MGYRSGRFGRFPGRLFRERQIYHRSDGVVHFISMSGKTQICLAAVIFLALSWVAYASVNVVFKEQIIIAKERDNRIIEKTYSKRLHDAQRAYDDVNEINHIIRQKFDETMADFSARHHLLESMVDRTIAIDSGLDALASDLAQAGGPSGRKAAKNNRIMIDPQPGEPVPRQSRFSSLQRDIMNGPGDTRAETFAGTRKASSGLQTGQVALLEALERKSNEKKADLQKILAATGIDTGSLVTMEKISGLSVATGGGGSGSGDDGSISSERFLFHAGRTANAIDELRAYYRILERMPLSSPLLVNRRLTSTFGMRDDPIIPGRKARHNGIDFGAYYGSPVLATAPGTVKRAGRWAAWGLMVEIDHGNGFISRYAHLSRISVKRGEKVDLHSKVGELGNTGRSTGPHLHYEILFRKRHVDPEQFIEAGRYVFES